MSRGVQQGETCVLVLHDRLFGEDRDPAVSLEPKVVEEAVLVIDPPELFDRARDIHHRFTERRFSRIDMG